MKSIARYLREAGKLFETGKYEEALELIDEAIALYPEDYDAHMNRKLLLTKLGYYEEMLECEKTCARLKLLNDSARSIEEYLKAWNTHYIAGEYNDALRVINEAITKHVNNAEAYFNKGITLNRLSKHEEALELYNKAISIKPYYIDAHYRIYHTRVAIDNGKIMKSLSMEGEI